MDERETWTLMHEYRRMSVAGGVPPMLCPEDDEELVMCAYKGKPAWRCFACDSVITPGIEVLDLMKKNLEEL